MADQVSGSNNVNIADVAGIATRNPTYRSVLIGKTPVGSATAPFFVLTGSATKTIQITRIRYTATAGTGAATDVWCARFTAISGGTTATAPTTALLDTNNAAASATITLYSVVPTTATMSGGYLAAERYETITAAVTVVPQIWEIVFNENLFAQPPTIRGTGQFFGIGISAAGTTPVCDAVIEWVEF